VLKLLPKLQHLQVGSAEKVATWKTDQLYTTFGRTCRRPSKELQAAMHAIAFSESFE
jgi:hypothetical protein